MLKEFGITEEIAEMKKSELKRKAKKEIKTVMIKEVEEEELKK